MARKHPKKGSNYKVHFSDEQSRHMKALIEDLTHSGQKTLDIGNFKKLKSICKKSDNYVELAYHLIIEQLERKHSEVRFSAFQIIDELCRKSYRFRDLVVTNLKKIVALTTELESGERLPPPRNVALNLQKLALKTVHEWYKEFGSDCKTFEYAVKYLQKCKKVDFTSLQVQSAEERERDAASERRNRALNEQRIEKVKTEFNDMSVEIVGTIKSLENGLALLLPRPEDFFITEKNGEMEDDSNDLNFKVNVSKKEFNSSSNPDVSSDESNFDDSDSYGNSSFREMGAINAKHSVQVNLIPARLHETPENAAIIENVRDLVKLITNTYLPKIKAWLQIMTKSSGSTDFMKKLLDYKLDLEKVLERYKRLDIVMPVLEDDCVSTDSEMEEVVDDFDDNNKSKLKNSKSGSEHVKDADRKQNDKSEWSIISKEEKAEDPTTLQAVIASQQKKKENTGVESEKNQEFERNKQKTKVSDHVCSIYDEPQPSTSKELDNDITERKKKLLEKAPKLPFDIDLYHWEDEEVKAPTLLPVALDGHRFWSSVDEVMEVAVPEGSSRLRTRVIEYVGEFEPVTRSCRFPSSQTGKLCPRQDRYKCPFHGIIVPRDEMGKCINPEDEKKQKIKEEKEQAEKPPDWQDPSLLKAIEMETGINLKMPDKKGKKRTKKKHPGLTDLKKLEDTTMNRLAKKVFKKSAMRRVANAMDSIDRRRFRDKYGDQFHYMHDTA